MFPNRTGAAAVASQTSTRTALIKIKPASDDRIPCFLGLHLALATVAAMQRRSLDRFDGCRLHRLETLDRGTRVEQQPFPAELNVEAGAPYHLQCGGIEGR